MPTPRTQHSAPGTALVIFAKAPVPGQVKTRLCPPLTPDEAATLHGSFVLDTLERTKLAATKWKWSVDRYLACAPSAAHVFFRILEERYGVQVIDQAGSDLGERMSRACESMFARGYGRVVMIGTDVPTVPIDHFVQALAQLESHDLVLGPALDGGYYLIGLKRMLPELFTGIPWSTNQVLKLTQEKASSLGLLTMLIPSWRDVDTLEDLQAISEACALDGKRPKPERVFSSRTAGVLETLAKRLRSRA